MVRRCISQEREDGDSMRQDPNRALEWTKIYPVQRASIANLSLADAGRLLLLLLYCAEKVNGGVIKGARNWTRKQWRNETLLDEIPRENQPNFWHFSQENLIVDAYDAEAEKAVLSKRKGGIKGREKQLKSAGYPAGESESEKEIEEEYIDDDDDSGQARLPETIREVEQFLLKNEKHMNPEQAGECARGFLEMNEDNRWRGADGLPLRNWKGAARNYADNWKKRNRGQRRSGGEQSLSNAVKVKDNRYKGL